MTNTEPPIACTLDGPSYQARVAAIRALWARGLRESRREGRRLHLRFDPAVAAEVEEMVRLERACCAFLGFSLSRSDGSLELMISVPPNAAEAADELLSQFSNTANACDCAQ